MEIASENCVSRLCEVNLCSLSIDNVETSGTWLERNKITLLIARNEHEADRFLTRACRFASPCTPNLDLQG